MGCGSDRDFEVFLNFRATDTRHTVADFLYNALTHAGVRVFLDEKEIQNDEVIEGEALKAITNSKIYITIFSKGYASSRRCLCQLAKMMECRRSSSGNTRKPFLPVFYDVDITKDIKLRSQVYKGALEKHKKELGEAVVKPWEDALKGAATLKGWSLRDHGLVELANLIKKEVLSNLNAAEVVPTPDGLVGIHEQIEAVMQLLDEGSPDIRFIVIYGSGGIGKTTLANSIFKKISSHFQGSCILSDIRQSSRDDDIVKLQKKLLSDTLLEFIKISNVHDGIAMISRRLHNRKVLIVLDDVDKWDHLMNLAARSEWFGLKSRIIVTTKSINFLQAKDTKEYNFYEVKELDYSHALQLFCRHTFRSDFPPSKYYNLSTEIVATMGGLPLAIQVIGSSLHDQDDGTWKFRLEKLKGAHKDTKEMLMISYWALEYEQQQIFLDIACFFNNEKKMDPIYFWEACEFYPNSGIKILERRNLIKVNEHDEFWMHDELRDIGRVIALSKCQDLKGQIPAKPSRLWSPEVALDVVRRKEAAESIVALKIETLNASCSFVHEEFAGLVNLKFLQLQGGNFEGDFKNALEQLRWLSWFDCPRKIEATNLNFKNLVVLKLSGSQITENWGGWCPIMVAKQLKVLNLINCGCLTKTPDFSTFLELERLILKDCKGLTEIDRSISKLKHLDYLEISKDSSHFFGRYLPEMPWQSLLLPNSIGGLMSLTVLKIHSEGLTELHPSIGELSNLKHLHLWCPQLQNLPGSIGKLTSLLELDISFSGIKRLPDSIGFLKQLNILRMNNSAILRLPDSIERLESLNELQLSGTKVIALPKTIGNLKRLKVIDMGYTWTHMLPKAIGKVENLEELRASDYVDVDGEILEEIGKLSTLRILDLSNTMISRVPTTISRLSHLQELVLGLFSESQELPKLPTSLKSLKVSFSSLESHKVPNLSYMTNLVTLTLCDNSMYEYLGTSQLRVQTPEMKWLARLAKLEKLTVVLSDLILPPIDLSCLSHLRELDITCFDPQSLTHLPSSIESLTLWDVNSPSGQQLFLGLNNLPTLTLRRCWYREIQVDGFGQLKNVRLHTLELVACEFVKRLSNLSCLKELRTLEIKNCPHLVDVQDLGELESLRSLSMSNCSSIQRLPDLLSLRKLEELRFVQCESLESLPNVDEEIFCYLEVSSCSQFDDFHGPYKKQKRKKRKITKLGQKRAM